MYTLTLECVVPAMSYARRSMSATMSSSSVSIPNLSRSGTQLIRVQSLPVDALMSGSLLERMLSRKTCLNFFPSAESDVSTTNSRE